MLGMGAAGERGLAKSCRAIERDAGGGWVAEATRDIRLFLPGLRPCFGDGSAGGGLPTGRLPPARSPAASMGVRDG